MTRLDLPKELFEILPKTQYWVSILNMNTAKLFERYLIQINPHNLLEVMGISEEVFEAFTELNYLESLTIQEIHFHTSNFCVTVKGI